MSKPSKDAVDMAVKMSKIKPSKCKTETHSVITRDKHGVTRTEVTKKIGEGK
jgi:hypothetical protein